MAFVFFPLPFLAPFFLFPPFPSAVWPPPPAAMTWPLAPSFDGRVVAEDEASPAGRRVAEEVALTDLP